MHDTSRHSGLVATKSVATPGSALKITALTMAVGVCAVGAGRIDNPLCVWLALGLAFAAGRLCARQVRNPSALNTIVFAPSPNGADQRGPAPAPPAGPALTGGAQ